MKTFHEEYKRKLVTAQEAARQVRSYSSVDYGHFCTKPIDFDAALGERAGEEGLEGICARGVGCVLPIPEIIKKDPKQQTFRWMSGFWTALDRALGDHGLADYVPVHYHHANELHHNDDYHYLRSDVWCGQVTPMDRHGHFNFGIGNSANYACAKKARVVIVEVNESLPRCLGGYEEGLHISEVDYIIEGSNSPVFSLPAPLAPTPAEKIMAQSIVESIPNGACLQLGIGALPNTIGMMLAESDVKNLGVQSEMFCDAFVRLYDTGQITNLGKSLDKGRSTFTFALGSPDTYEFMDDNPFLASCPVEYCNDPSRVRLNDRVISINNILEIDLFSQVCSESSGVRQISGTGGQLDFVIGASESPGGRSFLAFASTYKDKEGNARSRIRPLLTPGAIVTVPRASVQWLVTEYGKICLKGKSIWERAEMLIGIAHPDFRDELIEAASQLGIWKATNKIN